MYLYFLAEDSVWSQVLNMRDSIQVDYSKFEEMFSQKEVVSPKASLSPEEDKGLTRRNSSHNQEVNLSCNFKAVAFSDIVHDPPLLLAERSTAF